jgi:hypothetical protein
MTSMTDGPRRLRRRGYGPRDGRGQGRGPGLAGGKDSAGLATRTAVRAVIAAGTYVAQDVRDRDGLTRPMLRRAALRMAICRQEALRRLGTAYLRADPPAAEELSASKARVLPAEVRRLVPPPSGDGQVIDVDPATVIEDEQPGAPAV